MSNLPSKVSQAAGKASPGCPPGALRSKIAKSHHNWVTEVGGLPRYIERIACHVHFGRGHDISSAIAIAVADVKKMCSTGMSNFGHVNAGAQAEACKAVAEWEAKRAAAHAISGTKSVAKAVSRSSK